MNGKNFGQRECGREFIPNEEFNCDPQENEKNPAEDFSEDENFKSIAEDFEIFLEISKILAEQEYRKRRFLKIFKLVFLRFPAACFRRGSSFLQRGQDTRSAKTQKSNGGQSGYSDFGKHRGFAPRLSDGERSRCGYGNFGGIVLSEVRRDAVSCDKSRTELPYSEATVCDVYADG